MSATATSQQVRQPVSRLGGWIAGAIMVVSIAAIIVAAVATFTRSAPAITFDPTAAQRIHLAREYGSAVSYDATGPLETHVLRENDAAPAGTLFDHVLRENGTD